MEWVVGNLLHMLQGIAYIVSALSLAKGAVTYTGVNLCKQNPLKQNHATCVTHDSRMMHAV